MSNATEDVLAERQRQIDGEGWTPAHDDDAHDDGDLAAAGAAYALNAADQLNPLSQGDGGNAKPVCWPWAVEGWKPKNPRRDLVRAAALLIAEIERLDRAALKTANAPISQGPVAGGVDRLPYATEIALARAYRCGQKFILHYHGKAREVTSMRVGAGCVWVCAGPMLPVHIRPDGTSKDGPSIWMAAVTELTGRAANGREESDIRS